MHSLPSFDCAKQTSFIQDKLAYGQVVTNCRYSIAQMHTWEECLPTRMGMHSFVTS